MDEKEIRPVRPGGDDFYEELSPSSGRLGGSEQARRIAEEDEIIVPVMPLTAAGFAPVTGATSTGIMAPAAALVGATPLAHSFPAFLGDPSHSVSGSSAGSSDHLISDAVETALVEDGRLSPAVISGLRISVADDGIVTLSGAVPHAAEGELAASIAQGVTGVRQVRNTLGVGRNATF